MAGHIRCSSGRARQVNWSLWTVPYEFGCYAIMSGLIAFGLLKRPYLLLLAAIVMIVIALVLQSNPATVAGLPSLVRKFAVAIFASRGARLFVAFVCGIVMFLLRKHVPYSRIMFALSVAVIAIVAMAGPARWLTDAVKTVLLAAPLTYVTAFLGVSSLPVLPVFHRGDYSYGVYLYGMPVQQALLALLPGIRSPLAQFAIAVPVVTLCAIGSWHLIEKPVLGLRKSFSFVARVRGVADAADTKVAAPSREAAELPEGLVQSLR